MAPNSKAVRSTFLHRAAKISVLTAVYQEKQTTNSAATAADSCPTKNTKAIQLFTYKER